MPASPPVPLATVGLGVGWPPAEDGELAVDWPADGYSEFVVLGIELLVVGWLADAKSWMAGCMVGDAPTAIGVGLAPLRAIAVGLPTATGVAVEPTRTVPGVVVLSNAGG